MGSQESHRVIVRVASGDMSRYANKRDHTDMGLFEVAPDAGLQETEQLSSSKVVTGGPHRSKGSRDSPLWQGGQ